MASRRIGRVVLSVDSYQLPPSPGSHNSTAPGMEERREPLTSGLVGPWPLALEV